MPYRTRDVSFNEVANDVLIIHQTKLVNLSAFTMLIYDYIITFGQEKDLFWCRGPRTGFGTALFLTIRYLTLIVITFIMTVLFMPNVSIDLYVRYDRFSMFPGEITNPFCRCDFFVKFQWFAGVVTVMLAEATLQTRIYAMYGNSKRMLYFLLATFTITFGIILGLVIRIIIREHATFFKGSGSSTSICVPQNVPDYYCSVWIPLFIHEILLCGLAVYKGIQSARSYTETGLRSRFMMFLVVDSVEYYFAFLSVFFALELVWVIKGISYIELPFGHAVVIGSIMCQRLLLKIRSRIYTQTTKEPSLEETGIQIEVSVVKEEYPMSTFHSG